MEAEPLALVGVVGRPFGLHGDVYVRPEPDLDDDFPPGRVYRVLGPRAGGPAHLTVETSRLHSGKRLIRFAGVTSREEAVVLRGLSLGVARAEVVLTQDTFWASDLVGREVVDDEGAIVGIVERVVDGPAHDYVEVARPDGGEVLIPAVEELLDVRDDRIVVHPIPGLLGE